VSLATSTTCVLMNGGDLFNWPPLPHWLLAVVCSMKKHIALCAQFKLVQDQPAKLTSSGVSALVDVIVW